MTMNDSSSNKAFKDLGPYDVLLGRGTGPNEQAGNIKFRAFVRDAMKNSTGSQGVLNGETKSKLAKAVMAEVKAKGGRFVKKVKSPPAPPMYYIEVDEALALDKTKQSFRHQLRAMMPNEAPKKIIPKMSVCLRAPPRPSVTLSPQLSSTTAYLADELVLKLRSQQQSLRDLRNPMQLALPAAGSRASSSFLWSSHHASAILIAAETLVRREHQQAAVLSRLASSALLPPPLYLQSLDTTRSLLPTYQDTMQQTSSNSGVYLEALLRGVAVVPHHRDPATITSSYYR
jgi:hypothetical protein